MIASLPPVKIPAKNDIAAIVRRENEIHSDFWSRHSSVLPESSPSTYWTRERRLIDLTEATYKAKAFETGWDGYDAPAPNDASVTRTLKVLYSLWGSRLDPYSVLPSADGGIGISFRGRDNKRAVLELLNDGTSSYLLYGRGYPTVGSEFDSNRDLPTILQRLEEYL